MSEEEALRECPFCGGKAAWGMEDSYHGYHVRCEDCGVRGPKWGTLADPEVNSAWNTRRSSPAQAAMPVAVKALEWTSEPPYSVARVSRLFLLYSTECVWDDGKFLYCQLSGNCLNGTFASRAEARAAAQSDYETRVRSALAPSDAMPVATAASVDAVTLWRDLCEKDRTSPPEYPDMALITFEELRDIVAGLRQAASGHPDHTSPMTIGPEAFLPDPIASLRDFTIEQMEEEIEWRRSHAPAEKD